MKDTCLSDDEIAAYVDGVVKPESRKKIEEHLARCGICLHNVAELRELVGSNEKDAALPPRSILARAESIIAEHTQSVPQMEIAIALRKGICRLLETTGDLLLPRRPSTVPLRRERQSGPNIRVAKMLSGYLVTAEFTVSKDEVQPRLALVEEASSAKPDGVKAKLYSPGACETKYSRQGKLSFSPVGQGVFRIDIEDVGRIRLEIK